MDEATHQGLDIVAYCLARLEGNSKTESVIIAGSKCARENAGSVAWSLERSPKFDGANQEALRIFRATMAGAFAKANAVMIKGLDSENWRERQACADYVRKIYVGDGRNTPAPTTGPGTLLDSMVLLARNNSGDLKRVTISFDQEQKPISVESQAVDASFVPREPSALPAPTAQEGPTSPSDDVGATPISPEGQDVQ